MHRLPAAFVLGALSVAGFAPFGLFPLPFLTLALLFHGWRDATPARAAKLGYAWGLGFFLAGVSWVYVSLNEFGGMAAPVAAIATLLFCLVLALFPALTGYAFARLRSGRAVVDALLVAALWTLAEWLRGWVFTGFPWLSLGYSQTPPSPLSGFAPLLGVYGVGLLVAFGAAAAAFAPRGRAAVLLALLFAAGFVLRGVAFTHAQGEPLRVSLLQGNIPQSLKWDPQRAALSLDTYAALVARTPADLTVLPETALPVFFDELPRELLFDLTRHGPVLAGVAVRTRENGQLSGYTNGAVALQREGTGFEVQGYAKRHLVPFGEYAPPGFGWFFKLARIPMSDFSAGPPLQPPLAAAGQKLAPTICYEDLFGEELIRALPAATLLVNLSNTAWFGDSLAQPQHLQISQMRALETGRPMLRATNTGMTAAIAADGTVVAVLEPFTTGALVAQVHGHGGTTPYVRYGNVGAVTLALLALLPALLARRRKR